MPTIERRRGKKATAQLRRELNDLQQFALVELEKFGWELKFVRHKLQTCIPVVFSADRRRFAILDGDGNLNENPGFDIRH